VIAALLRLPGFRAFRSPGFRILCAGIFCATSAVGALSNALAAFHNYAGGADINTLLVATRRFWAGISTYDLPRMGAPDQFLTGPHSEPYPPTTFALLWPWSAMPDALWRASWLLLGLLALAGLIVLVYRGIGRPTAAEGLVAVGLALLLLPVRETIFEGQFGILVALCMVGAALAWERHRDRLAGALLAVAIAVKLTPALLLLYLLLRRRFRVVAWAAGWSAALLLASLPLVGTRWIDYARLMGPISRGTAFAGNQSLPGVILRLLRPGMSGQPILPPPPPITALSTVAQLAVLAALGVAILRFGAPLDAPGGETDGDARPRRWTELALVLVVLPLIQPFAWFHHWAAAVVLALVASRLGRLGRLRPWPAAGLALAFALNLATYPTYRLVRNVRGPDLAGHPDLLLVSCVFFAAVAIASLATAGALRDLRGA
jgi:hypothetical protein